MLYDEYGGNTPTCPFGWNKKTKKMGLFMKALKNLDYSTIFFGINSDNFSEFSWIFHPVPIGFDGKERVWG